MGSVLITGGRILDPQGERMGDAGRVDGVVGHGRTLSAAPVGTTTKGASPRDVYAFVTCA